MNKQEFNAEKKAYKQPAMNIVEIDNCDIICQSGEYTATGQDGIWEETE